MAKRTLILVICRIMNFGVVILSPIFMVRLFDVTSYGQYREFVLYYFLLSVILIFSIQTNPIYFISRYPGKERQTVTHTALMLLAVSLIGSAAVYLGKGLILSRTSYDFILPLILFIFFNINLEYYESYCLGRKRADHVLYFSATRAIVRMIAVIIVAWITRNIMAVIWTIVFMEIIKCMFVLFASRKLFTRRIELPLFKEQLRYIVPMGSAAAIERTNTDMAKLVVSSTMGANMLAIYSIGNYQVPIIQVVRSSIMDVLFPEMTQSDEHDRIVLWKKATIALCFLVFPLFVVFSWFAKTVIVTLFTEQYVSAVPIFQIYLTLMLIQCFDMGIPLRAINKTIYFVTGNIVLLVVNLALIAVLFRLMGIYAPPIAFITGTLVYTMFLAWKTMSIYGLPLPQLVVWKKLLIIIASCAAGLPVLFAGSMIQMNPVIKAVVFSAIYLGVYLLVITRSGIDEVNMMLSKFRKQFKRR
ncbi:MAG: oligosaccharide flippase family protein [Candidatus Krumholzibacteria bacterium]|jgi:O-antigen/teichoic acid export membrane protein|nr:oligosaccharide flippase family protein [Candidatus Krumholzibacteria bacterium]